MDETDSGEIYLGGGTAGLENQLVQERSELGAGMSGAGGGSLPEVCTDTLLPG